MFNLHITLLMAFDGLRSIVDRFGPNHKANGGGGGCIYATSDHNGVLRPVCIVGQFFADLGILRVLTTTSDADKVKSPSPTNDGDWHDGALYNVCGMTQTLRDYLANRFGVTMDDEAFDFLSAAQFAQDGGDTWGEAVEHAAQKVWEGGNYADPGSYADRLNRALNV